MRSKHAHFSEQEYVPQKIEQLKDKKTYELKLNKLKQLFEVIRAIY